MKVLVTGGAGYVGSVVTEELINSGYEVAVFDNLQRGHRRAVLPEARFFEADLADRSAVDNIFSSGKFDAVMHLAADSLVSSSMVDPGRYFHNNITCGLVLLDVMLKYGVQKLVFSSSAAVYGEPQQIPVSEEHPASPVNVYGETKLMFENILKWYGHAHGLQYVSMRYFNAAGASVGLGEDHNPETHLIPNVLRTALDSERTFSLFGDDYPTRDGSCVRDYVHVCDVARAHLLALEKMDSVAGRAYNLGSGNGYTVKEVVEAARRITGKPVKVVIKPGRSGDPAALVASREKARRDLGWQPQLTDLESIVGSAWDWMQRHPEGYVEEVEEAVVLNSPCSSSSV